MSLPARAFQASNRYQTGSNVYTTISQGGGEKKAGLVYQVGRTQWTNIALGTDGSFAWPSRRRCCTVGNMATLAFTSNISRPIGSTLQPVPYWN
jgi:hypothetical protein